MIKNRKIDSYLIASSRPFTFLFQTFYLLIYSGEFVQNYLSEFTLEKIGRGIYWYKARLSILCGRWYGVKVTCLFLYSSANHVLRCHHVFLLSWFVLILARSPCRQYVLHVFSLLLVLLSICRHHALHDHSVLPL